MDVRQDTALGDCHLAQELVQLLIVADRELQVARVDAGLLVVAGRVTGKLEDLSAQILKNGSEVHRRTSTESNTSNSANSAINTATITDTSKVQNSKFESRLEYTFEVTLMAD